MATAVCMFIVLIAAYAPRVGTASATEPHAQLLAAAACTAPSRLVVTKTGQTSATLQWLPPVDRERCANITLQRQYAVPSHIGQYFTVAVLPPTTSTFTVPGLLERQRYTFRACGSPQACSPPASALTLAADPTLRGSIIADANATFPRQGEGTILRDGSRLFYFYARFTNGHDVGASVITFKTSSDGGSTWSPPAPQITPSDGKGRANACAVMIAPQHILLSYFIGLNHSSAIRVYRHSTDSGKSWGNERILTDGSFSYMTGAHDRMRKLSNGRIIIQVHAHNGPRGLKRFPLYTIVFFSDDNGRSFQRMASPPLQADMGHDLKGAEYGYWETALVELNTGGHLLMLGRTCSGWLAESRSTDFGNHWTVPVHNMQLPHPLAPPNLARLPGGVLLLVTEPHLIPEAGGLLGTRYVLAAQVSRDDGLTWQGYTELQYTGAKHTQDYASLFVDNDKDHTVHISHYRINCTSQCDNQGSRFAVYFKLPAQHFLKDDNVTRRVNQ